MVQIDISRVGGATAATFQGNPAELGDARSQLVGRRVSELAPRGTPAHTVLRFTHDAMRGGELNLRHLPPEVAQMILDSRAATMEEFFRSWGESIRQNAELDREAEKQRLLLAQVLGRASAVDPAVAAIAPQIRELAGLPDLSQASVEGSSVNPPPRRETAGLPEPQHAGVRLRQ